MAMYYLRNQHHQPRWRTSGGSSLWNVLFVYIAVTSIICVSADLEDWDKNVDAFWQGHCELCQHTCDPIGKNGYFCTCHVGYRLSSDGFSCIEFTPSVDNTLGSHSSDIQHHVVPSSDKGGDTDQNLSGVKAKSISRTSSANTKTSGGKVNLGNNNHHEIVAEMVDLKPTKVKSKVRLGNDVLEGLEEVQSEHEPLALIHDPTCQGVVCLNNGTCIVDGTVVRCDCPLGYGGRRCDKEVEVRYPKFLGTGFLALPVLKTGYKEFDIQIEFKPQANNGLLLFSAEHDDAKTDFFSITINQGYIEFRYDCGTGSAVIRSLTKVTIGNWNRVRAKRVDNEGSLWLNDGQPIQGVSKGAYSRITLRVHVYLGGYEDMEAISSRVGLTKPFVGCVQEVIINEYKYDLRKAGLVGDSHHGLNVGECSEGICDKVTCSNGGTCIAKSADLHVCLCPMGTGGENCQFNIQVHIPEFGGHSYLQHRGLGRTALSFTEIEMVFKPTSREGIVLYNGYTRDRKGDFISLAMREGHLEFRFDLGTGPGIIRSLEPISLGQWHWVRVSRTGLQGILEVDEQPKMEGMSHGAFTQLTLLQDLFIGGHSNYDHTSKQANLSSSFHGCIQKVMINDHPLRLLEDAIGGVNVEGCEHPCVGEPCMNKGECVPNKDVYSCYCPLGFANTNCEDEITRAIDIPTFGGQSFLMYTDRKINKRVSGSKIDIQMVIKFEGRDGVIFWSGSDQPMTASSDYLALGMVGGALQFRYNLGSGEAVISYNDTSLFDGRWHKIKAQRDRKVGYLDVDNKLVEGSSPGSYTMLNTNKILYVGGIPDTSQNTLRKFTSGFVGCIARLELAEEYQVDLVGEAQSGRNIKSCATGLNV